MALKLVEIDNFYYDKLPIECGSKFIEELTKNKAKLNFI